MPVSPMRSLAGELARHRLRVNLVLLGWITPEMTERSFNNPNFVDSLMPRIPVRRRWPRRQWLGGRLPNENGSRTMTSRVCL